MQAVAARTARSVVATTAGKLPTYREADEDDIVDRTLLLRLMVVEASVEPKLTPEGLAKLPPAFDKEGFVTAGNASGIVDGAAMMLLTTADKAREKGVTPLGRLIAASVVGVDPTRMGIGPAPAIRQALDKAGMSLADLDLIEIVGRRAGSSAARPTDQLPDSSDAPPATWVPGMVAANSRIMVVSSRTRSGYRSATLYSSRGSRSWPPG